MTASRAFVGPDILIDLRILNFTVEARVSASSRVDFKRKRMFRLIREQVPEFEGKKTEIDHNGDWTLRTTITPPSAWGAVVNQLEIQERLFEQAKKELIRCKRKLLRVVRLFRYTPRDMDLTERQDGLVFRLVCGKANALELEIDAAAEEELRNRRRLLSALVRQVRATYRYYNRKGINDDRQDPAAG